MKIKLIKGDIKNMEWDMMLKDEKKVLASVWFPKSAKPPAKLKKLVEQALRKAVKEFNAPNEAQNEI